MPLGLELGPLRREGVHRLLALLVCFLHRAEEPLAVLAHLGAVLQGGASARGGGKRWEKVERRWEKVGE